MDKLILSTATRRPKATFIAESSFCWNFTQTDEKLKKNRVKGKLFLVIRAQETQRSVFLKTTEPDGVSMVPGRKTTNKTDSKAGEHPLLTSVWQRNMISVAVKHP